MASDSSSVSRYTTSPTSIVYFTGAETEMPQGITISWIIEGMEDKMKSFPPGKSVETKSFSLKETNWRCILWPNGFNEENKSYISLFIVSLNGGHVEAKYEFNVSKNDQKIYLITSTHKFTEKGASYGYFKLLSHKSVLKEKLMSRGRMEIVVRISLVEDTPSPKVSLMEDASQINRLRKLSENFSNLLQDENSSDFLIICGDDKFHVHSNVLKARSTFFNGLLSNDFAENNTSHIVIKDMDSDTVKSLIEYMYTGRLKDVELKPIQLLKAADMYDFPLLRKSCEDELISVMNLENVVDLFVLAEDHNAADLRVVAKKMILENKAVIVKQDGWGAKLGTLVMELFEAI